MVSRVPSPPSTGGTGRHPAREVSTRISVSQWSAAPGPRYVLPTTGPFLVVRFV
jgi:hypothetical protein